jgi:L-alanine-DL-glutamate epimerase-like enolase superfamily enzyme
VTNAYVIARRPEDVAREVERLSNAGCSTFVLRRLDEGGMLDRERLGAARYAAGLQAEVELAGQSSPATGSASAAGVEIPEAAAAR